MTPKLQIFRILKVESVALLASVYKIGKLLIKKKSLQDFEKEIRTYEEDGRQRKEDSLLLSHCREI